MKRSINKLMLSPQASTNTLLAHFVSLICSLYIIRVVSQNPPVPPESLGAVPARA
jgi:hypothetical protein